MPNGAHGYHRWCPYWKSSNLKSCSICRRWCHRANLALDFPLSSIGSNLYLYFLTKTKLNALQSTCKFSMRAHWKFESVNTSKFWELKKKQNDGFEKKENIFPQYFSSSQGILVFHL